MRAMVKGGRLTFGVFLVGLVACSSSSPLTFGRVTDRQHVDARDWVQYIPGVHNPGYCSLVGKIEECTPGINTPDQWIPQHDPETWRLHLSGFRKGKPATGWISVDRSVYDGCDVGSQFDVGICRPLP